MSSVAHRETEATPPLWHEFDEAPFRYGWRDVKTVRADGSEELERQPLTMEDILHPQEEDFRVHTDLHNEDCLYLKKALQSRFPEGSNVRVMSDTRIDWAFRPSSHTARMPR